VEAPEKAVFISEAGMSAVRYHAGTKCRSENLRRTEEINTLGFGFLILNWGAFKPEAAIRGKYFHARME